MPSKEKNAAVIAALCEAFNRQPTKATFMAYEVGLRGVDDAALDRAASAVLQSPSQKFMPTPGELRALAITGGRSVESFAADAWTSLNKAIRRFGSGKSVNFRDALINATVLYLGGWERACELPNEEFEKWYKRDFVSTYVMFAQNGAPADTTGYLVGSNERNNAGYAGTACLYDRDGEGQLVQSKRYQHPTPEDISAEYAPLLEAPPATQQIEHKPVRPANIPRIELKRASPTAH